MTIIIFILLIKKDYFIEIYENTLIERYKNISNKEANRYLLDKFKDESLYIHDYDYESDMRYVLENALSYNYFIKSKNNTNINFTIKTNPIETTDTYDTDVLEPIMNSDQEFLSNEIEKCFSKLNMLKDEQNEISRDSYSYSFFSNSYNEYHDIITPNGFRELYQNNLKLDMSKLIIKSEFTHTAYNATYSYDYIEKYIKSTFEQIQNQGYDFNKYDFNFENAFYVIKDDERQKSKICYQIYNLSESEILSANLGEYIKKNINKKLLY